MNTVINTVVFDLGGVLVDWNPEHLYRQLIPDEGERRVFLTEICTREWHERHDAGATFAENAESLLQKYKGNPHMQSLITAWGARFSEMIGGPIAGTVDIFKELSRTDVSLYALTNWPQESFVVTRARFDFFSLFKDIIVSGDEKIKKPDPEIYKILVRRGAFDPRDAIYIDDREENLVPARTLGFTTILFTSPEALRAELTRYNLLPLQRCA